MKKITIVGFGRFGRTLYRLLKDDFEILLFNRSPITDVIDKTAETKIITQVKDVYQSEVIFYAVPIGEFAKVLQKHRPFITPKNLLIDVLSVKKYPKKIFETYIKDPHVQILLTHPMFGPDSSRDGFTGLPIILDKFKTADRTYHFWKKYFQNKKLQVVEMSAEEHDKLAASSQGVTHFVGRILEELKLKETKIDSLGAKKMLEVKEQTCHDTWQLFTNLQQYNPYTKQMRLKLGQAYDKLYNKLLPKQINPEFVTFGIQGGKGSFNEEALFYFIEQNKIKKCQIKYLYTSEKVLGALHEGSIDRGQFAIHNSVGGIVEESIQAMARYKFKVVDQFAIKVSHTLMIRSDAQLNEVTTIMTHPQSLVQCQQTLFKKYPHLKQTSGKGRMVDHALVAKMLSQGKLPKHIATLGSKVLAKLHGLTIVEENLQDVKENYTSFLVVKRI